MVVVAKKNGKPRRCVDFQQLNKASVRQTHPVKTPFHMAMSIPQNTWRTCLDAYEGFHSIPLRVEDRHLTTFVTEWGLYRYKTLPQGFLSATDGYTDRFDEITKDFEDHERRLTMESYGTKISRTISSGAVNTLQHVRRRASCLMRKNFSSVVRKLIFWDFALTVKVSNLQKIS